MYRFKYEIGDRVIWMGSDRCPAAGKICSAEADLFTEKYTVVPECSPMRKLTLPAQYLMPALPTRK